MLKRSSPYLAGGALNWFNLNWLKFIDQEDEKDLYSGYGLNIYVPLKILMSKPKPPNMTAFGAGAHGEVSKVK